MVAFFGSTILAVVAYRFIPVYATPLMFIRTAEQLKEGNFEARAHLKGEDELAQFGNTFDAMAEAVERDRKLERRLTTDVAHELRTPLMAIQATVEAMVDGV